MDILENLSTLSIAELRKILTDNEIKIISQSKGELVQQVTEFCLTKIAMDELEQECEEPEQECDQNTNLIQEQNKEYTECRQKDLERQTMEETFEELSPQSLRMKRLSYYSK
jgi:hypothetical protein